MSVPARIGRYAVEREIGRGGMGRVFLAGTPRSTSASPSKCLSASSDDEFFADGVAEEGGDTASAALLHAALGERDRAFAVFSAITDWDYRPAIFVHHFFPDVLGPLRRDPRWQEILRNVARDWSGISNRRPQPDK